MSEKNQKFIPLTLGVLVMSVLIGYLVFAWIEPSQAPPGGNVLAPINMGPTAQIKTGNLTLPNLYLNAVANEGNIYAIDQLIGYNDLRLKGRSDEGAPIYYGASEHRFYTAGAERLRILNNGNIGISTTTPAYRLDIVGDIRWTGTLQGGSVPWARLTNFPADCPPGQYVYGIGGTLKCSASPSGIGGSGTTNYLAKFTTTTTIGNSQIYDNGTDVGIGTTAPGGKLTVFDNSRYYYVNRKIGGYNYTEDSAGPNYILLHKAYDGTLMADYRVFGTISAIRGGTGAWNRKLTCEVNTATAYNSTRGSIICKNEGARLVTLRYGGVKYLALEIANQSTLYNLQFTGWAYAPDGELLRLVYDQDVTEVAEFTALDPITIQGNVGIGTRAPAYKLDVAGDIRVTGDWYWLPGKNFQLYPTANNQEWSFDLRNQGTYTGNYWQVWSDTKGSILAVRGDTGNVGIGTTAPGQKLDVAGNINYTGQLTKLDVAERFTATVQAADFLLGYSGRRGSPGRALVDGGSRLIINYGPDWSGGLETHGNLYVNGNYYRGGNLFYDGSVLYANRNNTTGGGIWVSDDGGFYDYNNGFIDFRGSNGIRILEWDGSWGDNSIRAAKLCIKDDCRTSWPSTGNLQCVTYYSLLDVPKNQLWEGSLSSPYCPSGYVVTGCGGGFNGNGILAMSWDVYNDRCVIKGTTYGFTGTDDVDSTVRCCRVQ